VVQGYFAYHAVPTNFRALRNALEITSRYAALLERML